MHSRNLAIQVDLVDLLQNVRDRRIDTAVATLDILRFEAFGDLLDQGHCVGFLEEGRNNQQGFELATRWRGSKTSEVIKSWFYGVSVD